jgi:DNA modification methylase
MGKNGRGGVLSSGGNSLQERIQLNYLPLSELKLDAKNPRKHGTSQIRQIARSIQAFGFIVPVLIDSSRKVLAGHGRVMASRQLNLSEVPTIAVEHLNEAQARAFLIADNRLTENSTWDEGLLAQQLKELSLMDLDFGLEVTGFEIGEIDLRIQSLASDQDNDDPDDVIASSPSGPTVSRHGDLFLLGGHRVCCGSALEAGSYTGLMEDNQATMVITDPPYNVPIKNNVSGLGSVRHPDFAMGCGEMDQAQFIAFLAKACSLMAQHTTDGSLHYIFIDWRHLEELLSAGKLIYSELKNICVWIKNHTGMGAFYRSRHEFVLVFKHGSSTHRNNILLGKYGRDRTNVWEYPTPRTPSDEGNLLSLHPTVKPVRLIADAILDCTERGAIILDGFLGSGTAVIAAERVGRRCFGLELEPKYVDIIVKRWQAYSGGQARHAQTGKTFAELQEQRTSLTNSLS